MTFWVRGSAALVAALLALTACADTGRVAKVEDRVTALEDSWSSFEADCAAEQQAVLDRLTSAEAGEDRTQDQERSVCGQSITLDGAGYGFADASDYQIVNFSASSDDADSTGSLEQSASAGESLHGILEGIDEEVYQLLEAVNGDIDLGDRLVRNAVEAGLSDVKSAVGQVANLLHQIGAEQERLVNLTRSVEALLGDAPTTTTTSTTIPATTTTIPATTTTSTTIPAPTTTTTTPAPAPDGAWVIVYSDAPYDAENDGWPGPVEVLQWTDDGPFIFDQRADAESVLSAILDWAAAGSDDESEVNRHFGVTAVSDVPSAGFIAEPSEWVVYVSDGDDSRMVTVNAASAEDAARDVAHRDFPNIPRGWPTWIPPDTLLVYNDRGQVMGTYRVAAP